MIAIQDAHLEVAELPESVFDELTEDGRLPIGTRGVLVMSGDAFSVSLRSVSRTHVALLHQMPMGVGDRFLLGLHRRTGEPILLQCECTGCEPGGSGGLFYLINGWFS